MPKPPEITLVLLLRGPDVLKSFHETKPFKQEQIEEMKIELDEAHRRIGSAHKLDIQLEWIHSVMCAIRSTGTKCDAIYPVPGGQVEQIIKFGWIREYHFFTKAEIEASKIQVPFAMGGR